jgi:uncharacterized protein with HEPN domain
MLAESPAVKDERVYLGHIRDAINDIEKYTSLGRDAFMAERMRQDAVIRKLEIIGETVSNSPMPRRSIVLRSMEADRRYARSSDARLLRSRSRGSLASGRA